MNFEIHVTVPSASIPVLRTVQDEWMSGDCKSWHLSCIADDPDLGKGAHGYITTHRETLQGAFDVMQNMIEWVKGRAWTPIRAKIEEVVYDRRYP